MTDANRHDEELSPTAATAGGGGASAEPGGNDEFDTATTPEADVAEIIEDGSGSEDARLAAERLDDLQRLQAEYVNYKRRVDRDRDLSRERGTQAVLEALMPLLDDLHAARQHGDLTDGPFAAVADKLERILAGYGMERYGEIGEPFDPALHEALMHLPDAELPEGASDTTIVQVLMPGYRMGEKVLRPTRVAVADPN